METKDESLQKEKNDENIDDAKSLIKEKYRLDAAGKLFTYVSSPRTPTVYRFWATLKELVNVDDLQKAVDNIIGRFPYYQVQLTRGFLWHKWKTTSEIPQITHETDYPLQYIPIKEPNTFPYRIIASYNKIIVEFNHCLTDGMGALTFLKALIAEYLKLRGFITNDLGDIFRPNQTPTADEFEYSYRKNFKIGIPKLGKVYRAFHLPFELEKPGVTHVISGKMNVKDVLDSSKKWKVTLTEFLTAVYIDALQEIMFEMPKKQLKRNKRPIRIMIPINARNLIPSKTMRNFTMFIGPGIDPRLGEFSFKEIIEQVHHYRNLHINKKYLVQVISNYVALEINPFVHATPSFFKSWFVKPIYRKTGEALFSGFLTNLGRTSMPIPLSEEVLDIQLLPMNHPYFKSSCSLLTYFDDLYINFARSIKESIVEKKFFNKLHNFGIEVKTTDIC